MKVKKIPQFSFNEIDYTFMSTEEKIIVHYKGNNETFDFASVLNNEDGIITVQTEIIEINPFNNITVEKGELKVEVIWFYNKHNASKDVRFPKWEEK